MYNVIIDLKQDHSFIYRVAARNIAIIDSNLLIEISSSDLFLVLKAAYDNINKLPFITTRDTLIVEIQNVVVINKHDSIVVIKDSEFDIEDVFKN